jgi:hypothetical protein
MKNAIQLLFPALPNTTAQSFTHTLKCTDDVFYLGIISVCGVGLKLTLDSTCIMCHVSVKSKATIWFKRDHSKYRFSHKTDTSTFIKICKFKKCA